MDREQMQLNNCCSASRSSVEVPQLTGSPVSFMKRYKKVKTDTTGMVLIPGGSFLMGTNDREGFAADGEGPIHQVSISEFYMDEHAVANDEFNRFIQATGYVTEAECFGWSYVFHLFVSPSTDC